MSHRMRGLLLAGLGLSGAPALAGSRDFVVEHSLGGSTEQAAPYLDRFLRYAEIVLGWPAGAAAGEFFPDRQGAIQYIEHQRPGFGMVDPELWLELRKKDRLEVVATILGRNQRLGHLSVVVKDPALKTLADLKGKRLMSNHLGTPRFLSKVVFDGKLDAAGYFRLLPTPSPLKGLRAVDRGEAEATLLDDDQLEHMRSLEFGSALRVVFTSAALPPMAVVAFGRNTKPAERQAFAKMLFAMCSDAKGAEVCKALLITSFAPPDQAVYQEAVRRYER